MTDNTKHNTPQLRFPEFTGEWKEKKLGEVCNIVMGQSPSSDKYNTIGDGLPLIQGNSDIKDRKSIIRLYTSQITKICQANDILMSVRAPVGYISRATTKSCIGRGVCTINKGNDYIYQYLLSIEPSWEKLAAGSTFTCINSDDIEKHTVLLPPSPSEQQKIADCLSALDDMINTEGKKTEALRKYKRGLMQQLFPANGATTPQLRFPGFTREWKEKKLGDSFDERVEKNRGDLPLLSLGEEGLKLQSETERKDNSNADKSKYLRVALGDIAYNTMRMWQGRCVYSNIEGIVSPAYTVCKPKQGIDGLFHYYLFKTNRMIHIFHQNSQGLVSDTLNLKYDSFSKIKYFLPPTLAEQQKIADCLSSLDDMITAQAGRTEALREYKRGLMQQLFPQPSK